MEAVEDHQKCCILAAVADAGALGAPVHQHADLRSGRIQELFRLGLGPSRLSTGCEGGPFAVRNAADQALVARGMTLTVAERAPPAIIQLRCWLPQYFAR